MCGIAGIFNLDREPVSAVALRRMTDSLAHRGPDGEGHYAVGNLGLGHRRLAILDLSPAGHQPMMTADSRFVITYNGEVYNFQELRGQLEALGHAFHSRTDTEVVLRAFVQWGPACVEKFNGMFAFAIWDSRERRLFLARDRYGIKPLYYTMQGHTFLFASEIKAFVASGHYRTRLDPEALLEYFTFQNFFTDRTLFKDARTFPAGHWATISADQPELHLQQYWDFDFQEPERPASPAEYEEELDRLFRQAVRRQLVSDVDVGSYLSGGMDSGSITAIAAREIPFLKSFTCGFDLRSASGLELTFDERQTAEYMSYLFKTEHYEMVLKSGDMERCLPAVVKHLEEPRVGQSYPNYYAAKLASKFVKVVLSGTGGDELFGGYPWRYYRAVVNDNFEDYVDKYYGFWQRLIVNQEIRQVFAPIWPDVKHVWTRDIFHNVFKKHEHNLRTPADYVNHSLYFEAKTFLHGLLIVEDKLSMAHSLEGRVPFLDNDLVEFTTHLPVSLKLGNLGEVAKMNENDVDKNRKFFDQTRDGKLILRKVMERYIPASVSGGVKQGFSAPDASWFKGDSIEYVKATLLTPRSPLYEWLDYAAVSRLIQEHLHGVRNRRLLIWSLLNVDRWLRVFIGG